MSGTEIALIRRVPEKGDSAGTEVWPNPVKNSLQIVSPYPPEGETHFVITDLSGRTLLQGNIYSSKQTIDVSSLQAGVYLIQVINKEGLKQTVEFVKE